MRTLAGCRNFSLKVSQSKPVIKIGLDHALWTWAAKHASWVLKRFQLVKGAACNSLLGLSMARVSKDF